MNLTEQANQKTWNQIKINLPEFALFMMELSKEFGKLEKVSYEKQKPK